MQSTMKEWTCWAFISGDGNMITDSYFTSPDLAWRVGLGWPDEEDTTEAEKRGCRVFRVRVTEIEERE